MYNFDENEQLILKFWEEQKVFDKLRQKNKGKKRWSFLDGPITANNPMGVHHAWGRTYKDMFQRFKAMQGFDQRYQNGFDCQGLWVEREEEKDLGLKNKQDIEKFGILNFVKSCKKRVEKFSKVQTQQSIRLGYWMDWNNSYYTMTDSNNLHNWFLLKKYFENGWLYKGEDAVPWCWRCGTASSKHDIATEGYKEVSHSALFLQFPLKGKPNEYFLIFTTTPWTVPADVAIALNENILYVKVQHNGKFYWLAESRLEELDGDYEIYESKLGKELNGIQYVMPYASLKSQKESPHKVVLWELASGEEGTGIVHIAPGCGAEDFDLGKREKLPSISPLNDDGTFKENYEEFSSKKYSEVNKMVIKDLEQRGFLYKVVPYKHRYPHCWRCGEELVFRLVDEWYIKCKDMREKLIKENKKIKLYPEYGKTRQEDWFKNMGDWLISRKRYWGLPLPIWECKCGHIEVIGSIKELKEKAIDKKKVDALPEIHRQWIDEIKIKCLKCGKEVERVKDVGDAWLDAGIVPFSTIGPYLDNKKEWEKWFPADMISENMPGQFRGWFNALFWASVAIAGKAPFKSLFGYETLKDEKGEEMHKSKGNTIWFDDAVKKAGADPIRLLYCLQDPSQELRFGFTVLKEPAANINILYNMHNLIEKSKKSLEPEIEDKWIFSRLNFVIKKVTEELDELHPHLASRALMNFWLNDLSRGYIQTIRDRISSGDENAKYVLKEVYLDLIKICAPFLPFITEKIYQNLKEKLGFEEESIHLCSWPKPDAKKIDEKLEKEFSFAMEIIEKALAERSSVGIGVRWPLACVNVKNEKSLRKELQEIVLRRVNAKKIKFEKSKEEVFEVSLDTKMTPELEEEGYAREFVRIVQDCRKKAGLKKENEIVLGIRTDSFMKKIIEKNMDDLIKKTNCKKIEFEINQNFKNNFKEKIKEISIELSF